MIIVHERHDYKLYSVIIYLIYDLHVTEVIIPDVLHHLHNYQLRLSHEIDMVINTYEILAYSLHITVVA